MKIDKKQQTSVLMNLDPSNIADSLNRFILNSLTKPCLCSIIKQTINDYSQPLKSYFTFFFYNNLIYTSRNREVELETFLSNIKNCDEKDNKTMLKHIANFIQSGNWKSTSANTNLILNMLNKLTEFCTDAADDLSIIQYIEKHHHTFKQKLQEKAESLNQAEDLCASSPTMTCQ